MRTWIALLLVSFITAAAASPSSCEACPMCKLANEDAPATDANGLPIDTNARPRAYMYSILFMLSMPAVLLSSFGIAFYRMTRRARLIVQTPDGDASMARSKSAIIVEN